MPYAAIMYRVKPGHEDEIAEIFENFQRVDTPDFAGADGQAAGRLLGTAVFVKDDVVVRFIQYEGDVTAIGRHMGAQAGVHSAEAQLVPLLAEARDTSTPEAFAAHFRNSVMRKVSELSVDTHPAGATAS
ncbi:SchA/CurD-like domain-containing protein [Streptomyces sp. NPDC046716]|uniref:SchA/CurD-like domain-containing protein n=1 Tax=Streptomyces sp. NPDC046716 TaxID=3157093 RepID=UPI0033D29832